VQAVEKMLRRVIRENVALVARCAPGLWPVVADSGQVEQVIMNLAINARDAMPSGGRLVIETRNAELAEPQAGSGADPGPSRQVVALAVSDTGVGMTAETRARLFEPFFTTKPVGKGTGLGLTTVREIVKQSGGWIDVASEVDRGTTFTVYLPRAPEATVEVTPILRKEHDDKAPRGSETILLVEDEEALSVVMTEVLEEAGYTVIHTESPNDAVKRVESYPGTVHLLLSDVVMPEMNGPQLAARIRSIRPDVRILFMSGYPDDALGLASRELVRRIEKPFSQDLLLRAVRKALDVPVPSAGGGENEKPKLG
jgi:two-component system cell cycle sensor histidine kinase/response regulator CckA